MRKRVFDVFPTMLNVALMAGVLLGASVIVLAGPAKSDENDVRPGYRGGMMMGDGYMRRSDDDRDDARDYMHGYMMPGYMFNGHPMMDDDHMGWGGGWGGHMRFGRPGPMMGGFGLLGAGSGDLDLSEEQASTLVAARLLMFGNPRLTVGKVSSGGDDTILVEIVTKKENALVSRVSVHRKTGAIRAAS